MNLQSTIADNLPLTMLLLTVLLPKRNRHLVRSVAERVYHKRCDRISVPWVGSRRVAPAIEGDEPFLVNDRLAHRAGG